MRRASLALVVLVVMSALVAGGSVSGATGASAPSVAAASGPSACVPPAGAVLRRPQWFANHRLTVLVDSVLLSGEAALRRALPNWVVKKRGRPALMVRVATNELAPVKRVNKLVVIGIAYNSLWQRHRVRYGYWAKRFDREADRLLRSLRARGAEQFVWVTLRQPRPSTVPPGRVGELNQYSWYFPYTNERLDLLDARHDDLVLADWRKAGDRPGITYDTIHLNERGGKLMARTIKTAIEDEAERQACDRARALAG